MNIQNPITLTDTVVEHLLKQIADDKNATAFRLSLKNAGCSGYQYVPELVAEPQADDIAFTTRGLQVYVAKDSQAFVKETIVDYIDKGMGQKQLVFMNPNETNHCGCGESFGINQDR